MDDLKKKARERGEKLKLPYAGALLPSEAHALMQAGAKLVDVRTEAEHHYEPGEGETGQGGKTKGARHAALI